MFLFRRLFYMWDGEGLELGKMKKLQDNENR